MPEQAADEPKAAGKRLGRILAIDGELVEQRPEIIEDLVDRGLKQFVLAVEVVVERTHPNVGGLGDLEHRHVELSGRDEALSSTDERPPGLHLAPFQAVSGRLIRVGHAARVAESINIEVFVRNA